MKKQSYLVTYFEGFKRKEKRVKALSGNAAAEAITRNHPNAVIAAVQSYTTKVRYNNSPSTPAGFGLWW